MNVSQTVKTQYLAEVETYFGGIYRTLETQLAPSNAISIWCLYTLKK